MDTNRLKAKIAELKAASGGAKILWKPQPGKQVVRIVPYLHCPDWPFVELYFHYNIAKKPMLSPSSFNRPDPIKEFAEKLISEGDRDSWKHGKKIEPKRRTYVPILVRGEEDQGVKFWGFGEKIYKALTSKIDDPDWGDITHPMEGRDITVTFEKATVTNKFPTTDIDVKPGRSVVTDNRDVLAAMKEMPDISLHWDEPTYAELSSILEEYITTGQAVDAAETGTRDTQTDDATGATAAVASGTPPVSSESAVTGKADVMEAFGSYFDKKG